MSGWDVTVAPRFRDVRHVCLFLAIGALMIGALAFTMPAAAEEVPSHEPAQAETQPTGVESEEEEAAADGRAEEAAAADPAADADDPERRSPAAFTDEPIPLIEFDRVSRPRPLLEIGDPFLGTGNIERGIELPGGAVWQPQLLLFGTYRSAIQTFHDGDTTRAEWANRLDLFGNLRLSPTERLLVGIRPLDQEGRFTGYNIRGEPTGWQEEFNARITTLFFEGDIGQMFPDLDRQDRHALDWGFAVGRQPLSFQDGILMNDRVDAIGIVRNNILPPGGANLRATFLYGWGNVHRNDNDRARQADLFGVFTESDWQKRSVQADFVFVRDRAEDRPNSAHWGIGNIERFKFLNSTLRYLGSQSMGESVPAASSGHLLFSELSWTPPRTDDLLYLNAFWGIDNFASAARAPEVGGPLGRTGILFEAVGLGRYGAPLGNRVNDSVGAAIGYQHFFDDRRKQIVVELGGRQETSSSSNAMGALGARYQQAIGKHFVLQLDAFGSVQESGDPGYGGRFEIRYEF